MMVRCTSQLNANYLMRNPGCGKVYDDAQHWTICPHHPLGSDIKTGVGYCKQHDLFACHLCKKEGS